MILGLSRVPPLFLRISRADPDIDTITSPPWPLEGEEPQNCFLEVTWGPDAGAVTRDVEKGANLPLGHPVLARLTGLSFPLYCVE